MPWYEELDRRCLHDLAALVASLAPQCHRPAVGSGARRHDVQDRAFDVEHVAGPRRRRPADLSTEANDAAGDRQAIDLEPHGDRCGVPAAGGQATEERALRGLGIRVKRLRIEFPGKGDDLLLVEHVRRGRELLADVQVVQIEQLARSFRCWFVAHAYAPCFGLPAAASDRTASMTACGWVIGIMCPAPGTTTVVAPSAGASTRATARGRRACSRRRGWSSTAVTRPTRRASRYRTAPRSSPTEASERGT